MLSNYLPVLIFLVVSAGLAGLLLLLGTGIGRMLARTPGGKEKLSPYECGFEAYEDTRMKFDVRYYLVAILFIVFDLEIAFLFPWAVALKQIGVVRPHCDGLLPAHSRGGFHLRVEEGSARVGLSRCS